MNTLCCTRYTDLCYGYNAFWRRCLPVFGLDHGKNETNTSSARMLWGDGFEIESLITIRLAGASLLVVEVPSLEHDRLHGPRRGWTWLRACSSKLRISIAKPC